jgi:hypothetical protein
MSKGGIEGREKHRDVALYPFTQCSIDEYAAVARDLRLGDQPERRAVCLLPSRRPNTL